MTNRTCTKCGFTSPRHLARGLCDNCYFKHRSRQVGYGRWETVYTDATAAQERIAALRDLGIGYKRIAQVTGIDHAVLSRIPKQQQITRRHEATILAIDIPQGRDLYRLAAPGARVPITGTRRRLQALMRDGYSQVWLCTQISGSDYGNRPLWTNNRSHTTAAIADRVATVFDELHLTPGPSQRARNWATKQGWPPALAWDEDTIDDPEAEPDWTCVITGRPRRLDTDEFLAVIADHRALGRDDRDIARRLGVTLDTFRRRLYRAGLPISTAIAS